MTSTEPSERPVPAPLRSLGAAALAGVIHSVLFVIAIMLFLSAPSPGEDSAAAVSWYQEETNQHTMLLALNMLSVSIIAFLWFVAVIRRRVGEREHRFFGTVFLGSALLFAAMVLVAGVMFAAPALSAFRFGVEPDPNDIALLQAAGVTMISVVATRLEAVFILSTTMVARIADALPRILIVMGFLAAATLFIVPLPSEALILLFPTWVAVVSAFLLYRGRHPVDVHPVGA